MYCQLELGGICILSICAFCYMCNLFGVTVYSRDLLSIGVEGVDVSSVYVPSAICETYLV